MSKKETKTMKTMSLDEFFQELEKVEKEGWTLNDYAFIRFHNGEYHCPISAVAYLNIGARYGVAQPGPASSELGLDPEDALEIIRAADNRNPAPLRSRILEAVGLTDD